MKQNEENICRIDTDKAWNVLRERLENERLLDNAPEFSSNKKTKIFFLRVAAVAAVCAGLIFSVFYFSHHNEDSLLVVQNTEDSGTLVTTLEDGSTVYLAPNASLSYPAAFAKNQRKVELNGNALFSVSKNEKRPFVIETSKGIMIEVVGTFFAVQSSPDKPFELSVKQGKVNVSTKGERTVVPVEAGETVQLSTSGLSKSKITNPLAFSRFTNKMCFKDEKLSAIVHAINTMYGSPTVIAEESLNNRILTVTFENDSVETMTELICMALNLKQVNKQDTIYIHTLLK